MVDAARIGGSIPCYQHSLPLLGQYLNQQQGARPTIAEVDTGFLVIFFKGGRWTNSVTLTAPHADLLELQGTFEGSTAGKHGVLLRGGDNRNKKHALCSMGYDVFFRAVYAEQNFQRNRFRPACKGSSFARCRSRRIGLPCGRETRQEGSSGGTSLTGPFVFITSPQITLTVVPPGIVTTGTWLFLTSR